MAITSLNFFIFVAVTMLVYFFLAPKKYQWCVLLIASYVFYAIANLQLAAFMLFTTITVYLGGLWLEKTGKPRLVAALIMLCNFGVLASFKWWNTLAGAFNGLLSDGMFIGTGGSFGLPLMSLLLPLGISFYTFQAVGYLLDIYRGQLKAERNIAKFALFVSFFPQLIQGPISRHSELAEQLYASRKFDHKQALHGFQLMLWGLFKKLVIADRLILLITTVFVDLDKTEGVYLLIGIVVYTLWLYLDFSGGIDIVRGVGQMFGIIMPENFVRPFFAESLPEFWRRFHISLNNWWRDYLFYPIILSKPMTKLSRFFRKKVSKNLGKVIGIYIAIIIVRLINAMWLGAEMYFVVNGLYYGVLIVAAMILTPVFNKLINALKIDTKHTLWRIFQIVRTFILICISHVFLAAEGVAAGFTVLADIVRDFDLSVLLLELVPGLDPYDSIVVFVSLPVIFVAELMQERGIAIREALGKRSMAVQWVVMMAALWVVLIFGRYGFGYDPSAFVYTGF